MDNLMGGLFGGEQDRQDFQDFAQRYEKGAPWDDISDDEAANRYDQVARQAPQDVYEESARESFSRLEPEQREELGRTLRDRASQRGIDVPGGDADAQRLQDPGFLAQLTGQVHREDPGLLSQLLGGGSGGGQGGGGLLSGAIGKAALGGIAAIAGRKLLGGR